MSGLMNSYFYGKAGKGDYTVEQMPTTRKQLFFTTLRVRFSSMIGLNLLHVLFVLPLLIWVVIAWQTVSLYASDDAYKLGGEEMKAAYEEYSAYKTEYDSIQNAPTAIADVTYRLDGVNYNISQVEKGVEVPVTVPPVVEGGESTTRPATIEELTAEKAALEEELARQQALSETTKEYTDALYDKYYESARTYSAYRQSASTSNLSLSLLILIPLIGLAGVGSTGQMYVLRNWARDEHSFMWADYKAAVKANWKQGLTVGLLNGLSIYLCYVAYITYGNMATTTSQFFVVPQMLMVVLLAVWWMMNEIVFPMMVTYDMKLTQLLRNSAIMVVARLPISLLILLGSLIIPVAVLLLIPYVQISMLVLIVLYGLIGFSLTGFVYASYANSCFDRYLNPRIDGAEVNKGLRTPEEEDEDEQALQKQQSAAPVEEKEDRFWEHKKK